jgi:1,4-dihydroxy-2-naphthoyl-CoA hydrolase
VDLAALIATMPFAGLLGIEAVVADKDEVRTRLEWDERRCTVGGVLHGGVLMSLADSTGAICAFLNLPEGATTTTIESTTNLLRAVAQGHVEAVARPLHVGRTVIVVETELRDADSRLVAKTTQTQAVLAPR